MNDMVRERRIGIFKVGRNWIRESPDAVIPLFKGAIVVRAELMFDSDCIEYTLFHPEFSAVGQSQMAPRYEIMFQPGLERLFIVPPKAIG